MMSDGEVRRLSSLAFDDAHVLPPQRYRIPTIARLRVCEKIEAERELPDKVQFEQSLAERWNALTQKLPLFGSRAMSEGGLRALDALDAAMPWAAPFINGVEREIRIQLALGRPWVRIEPTLLVGPPGIGKSWIAARLGTALGLATNSLQLGNMSDDRTLSGTARGWSNTLPAWPLIAIASTRSANPLLILDELDKAGGSARAGRPHHALLAMIEPSTAGCYFDQCLLAPCDLSQINWIACANTTHGIPQPLLSRFRVVELQPPALEHFEAALSSIRLEAAAGWGVPATMLPALPEPALALLRRSFRRHRSIRRLARDARALIGAMLADGRGGRTH